MVPSSNQQVSPEKFPVGQRISLPGHFLEPVTLEGIRLIGSGYECHVSKAGGEHYQVILMGDAEVWRELAFWDDVPRVNQIKALLKEKYGTRFKSLTPTDESLDWLTGDHFYKVKELTYK
jgi:hypothetical protein